MNALELPGDVLFVCIGTSVLRDVSMRTYHPHITAMLASALSSFSVPPTMLPSFLYLICRLRHDDSVTNSILLDLVPGYVQCCRKGICYIARADITRYFLMLRPASLQVKLQVRFFRSQAPGGVETPPIQPERSHITISITLKLLN